MMRCVGIALASCAMVHGQGQEITLPMHQIANLSANLMAEPTSLSTAQARFIQVPVNTNTCPAGYSHIMTLSECHTALHALNLQYNDYYQSSPYESRPTGCLWHVNGNGYFNPAGKQPTSDQAPICQIDFIQLPVNTNTCPAGYAHIMTLSECQTALHALSLPYNDYYQSSPYHSNRPTGCLWHVNGNGYFNPAGQQPTSDQAPICQISNVMMAQQPAPEQSSLVEGVIGFAIGAAVVTSVVAVKKRRISSDLYTPLAGETA